MEPRFGHDFSQVRVHTDAEAAESARAVNAQAYTVGRDVVFAKNRYKPRSNAGLRLVAHELMHCIQQDRDPGSCRLQRESVNNQGNGSDEEEANLAEIVIVGQGEETDSEANDKDQGTTTFATGSASCPVTAVFLSTGAGIEKQACQVPSGQFGVSKLAHFRLVGLPAASGPVTVSEQFNALEDPYNVFTALKPNTYTTANSLFDDCYMVYLPRPLPPDFRLKVEQNHLLNGTVISKNQITYTDSQVLFCHFDRQRGSCDFGGRCKL